MQQSQLLCNRFPWCNFHNCRFAHVSAGQPDPELDAIQKKSYEEQLRLIPPMVKGEFFKDRASPALIEEYNRLMTTRASVKRQRL